jgi:hypothetical protein
LKKNLIVIGRFKGGEVESRRSRRGIRFFREKNEGIKVEGGACGSPPQLDGGI